MEKLFLVIRIIRIIIRSIRIMPKKLGQHFLKDQVALKKIAGAIDIKPEDTVIEIGPGHGELTRELGMSRIIAIEKDQGLAQELRKKFALDENIEIVNGDIIDLLPRITNNLQLTTDNRSRLKIEDSRPKPERLITDNFKIVGNIPYYITGKLLRVISELKIKPVKVVLTVQKEVAERIVARPPKMNLLSAIIQAWSQPEILFYIKREKFRPPPQVDSAVLALNLKNEKSSVASEKYFSLVKILFKQPRKTILNNLANGLKLSKSEAETLLEKAGIDPALRPQNLEISEISVLEKYSRKLL
jgi:16S rRNA (adenine1518-N6/adenine1519-N6)-dimethyltransferase